MRDKKDVSKEINEIKKKPIIPYQPRFKFINFYLLNLKIEFIAN